MGHRLEAAADPSSVRNEGKDEKKEKLKLITSSHTKERSDDHDDQRENEVLEFVNLLENSESSGAMKALLLKILNSNKSEELKPFLKDSSTDMNKSKKKLGKANIDSNGCDDKHKKHSSRRSSRTCRSELSEQNDGSGHSGMRKSTRTRAVDQGSKTNIVPHSPSSSLRGSRKSDSCLRKSNRDAVLSPNQKSKLTSSSSLLQLRMTRRSDVRRSTANLNQDEMQAEKQNANWNPVTSPTTIAKRRTSTGSFLGADKLRRKALGKISEKRIGLGNKKKNLSDDSGGDEDRSTNEMNDSKLLNSFAQFEPTGQVAYLEQTVHLHDLVDDRRSSRDSISSNVKENDETMPGKKGLRKHMTKQLQKKKHINRDKQSIASESTHDNHRSLSDEKQFHVNDLNDSVASSTLHSSFAS
jgi:hypothetical protein